MELYGKLSLNYPFYPFLFGAQVKVNENTFMFFHNFFFEGNFLALVLAFLTGAPLIRCLLLRVGEATPLFSFLPTAYKCSNRYRRRLLL